MISSNLKFDYILCNGVLHHTGDTFRAFAQIIKYLKRWLHYSWSIQQTWEI